MHHVASSFSTMASVSRSSSYPLVPMPEALAKIHTSLAAITATETVATTSALSRTLASDVTSPVPLPPFRASTKDGYAVSTSSPFSADGDNNVFAVLGESLAGGGGSTALDTSQRQCIYITTGAPLPDTADAVVMVEETCAASDGAVRIASWPEAGQDVRGVGSDISSGQVLLQSGDVIGAAEVGILLSCGVGRVVVFRRVVLGVMSTGDEVVDAGEDAVGEGKIVDSNRPMLLAAVAETLPFCEGVDLGIVRDEYGVVKEALESAVARCDVVITSGGVSMGSRDVVKPVLEEIADVHFGRVCMKPGKPLTFATKDGKCVIGLPGNPVSAFVCFHLAVAVAARTMAGWAREEAMGRVIRVEVKHEFRLDRSRPEYHRVELRWEEAKNWCTATSTGKQASSRLLSARSAHGLLMLPAGEGVVEAGAMADVYLLKFP